MSDGDSEPGEGQVHVRTVRADTLATVGGIVFGITIGGAMAAVGYWQPSQPVIAVVLGFLTMGVLGLVAMHYRPDAREIWAFVEEEEYR